MWIFAVILVSAFTSSAGVQVRFLANPADDSVARYDVYRSETEGMAGTRIGSLAPAAGKDTLAFADSQVVRGRSYSYSIKAVNAAGGESDPSEASRIAFPDLSLPDTLFPGTWQSGTPYRLPASAHPLAGFASLSVELVDSTRFRLRYDEAAGTLEFFSRSGHTDTGRVTLRAAYFGKFEDRDSLILIVAAGSPVGTRPGDAAPGGIAFPGRFSLALGPMLIRNLPRPKPGEKPGSLEIFTLAGRLVFQLTLARPGDLLWDGRGEGGALRPARYLLVIRDGSGRRLGGGAFSLLP